MLANRVRMTQQSGLPKGTVFDFPFTGEIQEVELPRGKYKLEVWGGESGDYRSNATGKGGYSSGVLRLPGKHILHIYVGGRGGGSSSAGGWNGGGDSRSYGSAGGGGTDIRVSEDSLHSRVIVAGGGGGTGYNADGGHGGGLLGESGQSGTYSGGEGGSQASGGENNTPGLFGEAQNSTDNGGAGGGGWYGGGSGRSGGNDSAGGGGSGYIHTLESHKPSGWLLTERYFLGDAETVGGDSLMPSPTGEEQTGHSGDGYARITVV